METTGRRAWWRGHWASVAAAALLVLGVMDLTQHYTINPGWGLLLSAARALPLVIYRWRPRTAWGIALGSVTLTALLSTPVSRDEPWPWAVTSVAALAVLAGVLGARGDRRLSAGLVALVTVIGAALLVMLPGRGSWVSVVGMSGFCAGAMVLGDALHGRRASAVELVRERDRRWLAEERARIARELHDVVAHHMSMITVQAETARYRLTGLPEPAVEEFAGIATLARGSLTELRTLLSALRDEDGPAAHAPAPDLGGLAELVERSSATGTPVRLEVRPDSQAPQGLPSAVQLSAYRIVQEALSNVVRHARGAPAVVTLELTDSVLRLEIVNKPPVGPGPLEPGPTGHGLRGLRERATLLGGTLDAGPVPGGGWRVRAVLPVNGAS